MALAPTKFWEIRFAKASVEGSRMGIYEGAIHAEVARTLMVELASWKEKVALVAVLVVDMTVKIRVGGQGQVSVVTAPRGVKPCEKF